MKFIKILRVVRVILAITILISPQIVFANQEEFDAILNDWTMYEDSACATYSAGLNSSSNGSIYMLGDSITARTAEKYREKLPGIEISARVGRSWTGSGQDDNANTGSQGTGKQAVEDDQSKIMASQKVIVALGTNGFEGSNPIDEIITRIREINPTSIIYWVDVANSAGNVAGYNQMLRDKESEGKITVIPWSKVVDPSGDGTSDPSGLLEDGTHPNLTTGIETLANTVASVVNGELPEQSGASSGGAAGVCVCTTGAINLTGSDNEEKSWNFLISKGLTAFQAAGAMGNMLHEGGFEPKQLEIAYSDPPHIWEGADNLPPPIGPAGQPGYGIVQWTSVGRKDGLIELAKAKGLPIYDLGLQLEYMWSELEGPYKERALDPLMATDDLAEATRIWQDKYEVGAGFDPRFSAAQDMLSRYGSSTGSTTSGAVSGGCSNNNGQIVGGYSLPLDKKWYDEHKEWFTKPHHDYPASDIPVPTGTPVYSMTAGTVILAPNEGGYGRGVTVDAGNGIIIAYGHGIDGGSVDGAKQGDTVSAGQLLMHSDNTGHSTGPHLHLDIRINGQTHCPQTLFVGIAEGNVPDIFSLPTSGCSN